MGILLGLFSGAGMIAIVIAMIELFVIIAVITAIFEMRKETKRIRKLLEIQMQISISDIEEEEYRKLMINKYDEYRLL